VAAIEDHLAFAENVSLVEDKNSALESTLAMLEPYMGLIWMMQIMAGVVAFAIIYNASTISLSERKREYATLRVLGMQASEVGAIMAFEYWTLTAMGIVIGVPFTFWMKASLNDAMASDMFTLSPGMPLEAFIVGAVGCGAAVFVSNFMAVRNIRRFDMVEVLKERD